MNFIKKNYKSILKYLGIYLFVCICYIYIFYFLKFGDSLTFYSFSHALKNGQVIYNDFNIITTPLYVIFMSLGLHIYDNYLMFIFEQAFLVTLFVYFVNKNLGGKKTLILFLFCMIDNCFFKFAKYEKKIITFFIIFNILLFINIMNLNKNSNVIRCDNERFSLFYTFAKY